MTTASEQQPSHGSPSQHRSRFRAQFGKPTGWLGALVGHLMARKNAPMNCAAVESLDVQPADRVLEIGFGPGVAIGALCRKATAGLVAGVDPSEVMLRQATRRNQASIDQGRATLRLGTSALPPFDDAAFDRVLTVNTYHHWDSASDDIREVRRVLRPGGTLLIALRMELAKPGMFSAPGVTAEQIQAICRLLAASGFHNVRTIERDAGRRIVCVLAQK